MKCGLQFTEYTSNFTLENYLSPYHKSIKVMLKLSRCLFYKGSFKTPKILYNDIFIYTIDAKGSDLVRVQGLSGKQ